MTEDTRPARVLTCLCPAGESSQMLTPLTEPVELDDADLDIVVGGVVCCTSACVSGASPDCCIS